MRLVVLSDETYARIKANRHILEELDPGGFQTVVVGVEHVDGYDDGHRAFLTGLVVGSVMRMQAGVDDMADTSPPITFLPKEDRDARP
jgi:hypothetical protein